MKKSYLLLLILSATLVTFNGCEQSGCTDPRATNYDALATGYDGSCEYAIFDRDGMLSHIGNNIIIARYNSHIADVAVLELKANNFVSSPSTSTLSELRTAHYNAYLSWQLCSPFEFGPGEDNIIRTSNNTFPTDTVTIENNISSGTIALSTYTSNQYKGFPALDFLLYGSNASDSILVAGYSTTTNFENRKSYLSAVVTQVKAKSETVYNAWVENNGNYIGTFVNANGTDVSSSLGLLTNQFIYDLELVKNAKVGVPLGKFTAGVEKPEQSEAVYGKHSLLLAKKSFEGLYNLYMGIDETGVDDLGYYDYLVSLETMGSNDPLAFEIKAQFDVVTAAFNDIANPISIAVLSENAKVELLYQELKKLVVLIKTDMAAAMGVSITYQDTDGD